MLKKSLKSNKNLKINKAIKGKIFKVRFELRVDLTAQFQTQQILNSSIKMEITDLQTGMYLPKYYFENVE